MKTKYCNVSTHTPPVMRKVLALAVAWAACLPTVTSAAAVAFDIPAQDLSRALSSFAAQSRIQVLYEGSLAQGLRSTPLKGHATPEAALKTLLAAAPVAARFTGEHSVTLEPKAKPLKVAVSDPEPDTVSLEKVVVEGQREYASDDPRAPDYTAPEASTATRTKTPLLETPVSVQVVPKQVMRDQQAYRLGDVVKNVSNVQQRFSGGGYDRFVIRGFDLDQVQYRNGVRIKNLNFDLANAAQVEVLKGPASVLYGRAEPGGLINVVTKRPFREAYYSLEQRFGSYDYYRTQIDATGPVTSNGDLAYGFDLSYLNSKSFRDFGANDRIFLAPSLSWHPTTATEVNLTVEYLHEDRVYDSGIPAIGKLIAKVPISRQYDQPGLTDNRENILVDFNWSHAFNDNWTFRNGVVSSSLKQNFNEIYSDSVENNRINRYTWFGRGDTDMHTVYVNLNGRFDTFGLKHDLLLGGEYYSVQERELDKVYSVDSVDIYNPVFAAINFDDIRSRRANTKVVQDESWYGAYFQDQITLLDQVHIMGGGRYDWASISSGYDDPAVFKADTLRDSQFSPRVGIVYNPWSWFSVYGHYVESFGSNNGRAASGKPFQPQTATQYEAGIKTEFFDKRLTSTLAYYHLTKNNLVTTDPTDIRFSRAIGAAQSQGIEVDVAGRLTEGLNLIMTYALTDTEITKDYSGLAGKRLPYVPLHSGSVWLKYEFQETLLEGLSLGAGVYMADKRFGDAENSYYDPGYARLDLYTAYRYKIGPTQLTAQLNVNNATDTRYYTLRNRTNNLPAEPLTVLGSLRLEY